MTFFFSLQLLLEDDEVFHKIKDVMRLSARQGSQCSMILVCSFFLGKVTTKKKRVKKGGKRTGIGYTSICIYDI